VNESREKIMRRIQKCLRLAQSPEPHEAAAALRQARALMDKHGITTAQADLSDIEEAKTKATGKQTVAKWEAALAHATARTLGCRVMFEHGAWRGVSVSGADVFSAGFLVFVGSGAAPGIASYAFEVLRRQLRKARAKYRAETGLTSAKHMDLFCDGWVFAVLEKIKALQPPEGALERVDEAIALRHPNAGDVQTRDRSGLGDGKLDPASEHALRSGVLAGKEAQLHGGLGARNCPALPSLHASA
jgi:hypothetical protein